MCKFNFCLFLVTRHVRQTGLASFLVNLWAHSNVNFNYYYYYYTYSCLRHQVILSDYGKYTDFVAVLRMYLPEY